MIQICHVIDHMGLGGAQTIVRDLVTRNENHSLFSLRKSKSEIVFKDIDVKRLKYSESSSKFSLIVIKELAVFVKEKNIDILHLHLQRSLLIGYLLKKLYLNLKVKLVYHHHMVLGTNHWIFNKLISIAQDKIDRIVCVSQEAKEVLIQLSSVKDKKVMVINNYYHALKVKKLSLDKLIEMRTSIGIKQDDFVVGYAGRLIKDKGVDTIIRAHQELNNEQIQIVIVGDGPYRKKLEKLTGDSGNIHFLGYRMDMNELYPLFDLCVLASKSEGSPMTFFEAQQYRVPFIGSNIRAIKEVVTNMVNGLIFEEGNHIDLAAKILMLYSDRSLGIRLNANSVSSFEIQDFELALQNYIYE